MSAKPVLCIYHGHCDDGFAAAWCVRHALGETAVEYYPGQYQKDPPDVAGRDVIMVDFSYKRAVIDAMAAQASTILILDHHKTAAEDLAAFPPPISGEYNPSSMLAYQRENNAPIAVHAVFDMDRSGAGIAWDFFHGKPRPGFIDYIEDRDLWRKSLPGGDEFTFALRSYPQDFDVWDRLVSEGPEALTQEGRSIHRFYRAQVEDQKRNAYPARILGIPCFVANTPYTFASEVAGEIIQGDAVFGACYFELATGEWAYSLRSRGGCDVSQIAKEFGGGGHANAAGFKAPMRVHGR